MSSAQERAQNYLGALDKEVCYSCHSREALSAVLTLFFLSQLAKYPTIANLEKQTGVPKAYAAIGVVALYFFLIIFNLGGQFLTNLAGFVIPGYYSLGALFTSNTADDTQWLTVRTICTLF